jgi:hypothetical protein
MSLASILDRVSQTSARFDYCIVPGAGDIQTIGKEQLSFDWVSRKPGMSRTAKRERLKLSVYPEAVVLGLGGDLARNVPDKVCRLFHDSDFFLVLPKSYIWALVCANVHLLPSEEWSKFDVDLVNGVDAGMGTLEHVLVSEAIHCKTRFISVCGEPRRTPESAVLRRALAPVGPCREITCHQFSAGYWDCIHELLDAERRPGEFDDCRTAGALEIAHWIRFINRSARKKNVSSGKAPQGNRSCLRNPRVFRWRSMLQVFGFHGGY